MTSKDEQVELGQLILKAGIQVLYIKNVVIEEKVNEHGYMTVRFLLSEQIQASDAMRYIGSDVQLMTAGGETVFGGKCSDIKVIYQNQYTEAQMYVTTASVMADKEERTQTYQDTGKTLNSIISLGIGRTSLVQTDSDITISEMISQENETDWTFIRRIANQYGKQLFVNSKTVGSQINIGNIAFREMQTGLVLDGSVGRNVDKVREIQGNGDDGASVYEFEENILTVSNLAIGVGYDVMYQGRVQTVIKSRITAIQGVLQNEITLVNKEGIKPSVEQSSGVKRHSSILTGTVMAVEGTNVKVDFGSSSDTPRWIPYANTVNNYFYSMPDEGDTVFVYYETGDSDKIVCLGSRHVNESPDFARYKDKMLTANNRMVKFGDKTLNIVGNREEYDGYGGEQAKIIFNDENGILIQSSQNIHLETTDSQNISIQAMKKDFVGMDALKEKFQQMYGEGKDKYEADGGNTDFDAIGYLQAKEWKALKQNIKDNLMAPFQVIGTVQELAGRIGGAEETVEITDEAVVEFTDGIVDIFAINNLTVEVGNSCITFSNGTIQIKSDIYMQLGTDRSVTYEHLEDANYTWRDMFLDVTQLALDIVGALPVPGLSTAANLVNAGISVARGDYVGAAASAGAAAASLLPGGNTVVAGGKLAATVATRAPKVMKAAKNIAKIVKALKTGAEVLNTVLTTGMAVYDVGKSIMDGSFDINDPECRQDVFSILQGTSTAAQYKISKNTTKDENGKPRFMDADERKKAKADRKQARRNSVANAKEKTRAKLDEASANRCKNGEPVDMVTGSFLVEQCDFIINDITGIYAVERNYESLLAGEDSPVGRGWTLSLFSTAYFYDDRVEIVLPDNHTETFLRTSEGFRNRRGGSRRLMLKQQEEGLLLTESETGLSRFYDFSGKQQYVMDRNGNRTVYIYMEDTLQRIMFASGQYLDFAWRENKIISMKDCMGRSVTYSYEGNLLTEVGMVTGGTEKYTYDNDGHVTDITDANAVTYVHNEYDVKGRVTRQSMSTGQEYIMLYADDDRTNTYLAPANGKQIHYIYNKDRQLVCTKYHDGTTQEIRYDEWENRVYEKDRRGGETRRIFDEYARMIEETAPNGLKVSYKYDLNGNCIRRWDNAGAESCYEYDGKGNLIKEIRQIDASVKSEVRYEHDRHGRITAFTDGNGNRETYRYETGFWRATEFVTAGGVRHVHRLDGAGRCVATENEDGISGYAYNSLDLLCMETDPLGHTQKYIYDRVMDLTALVRPNHFNPMADSEKSERYTYDAFHNRLTVTDETGAVTAVVRDGEGNVVKEINPNSYDTKGTDGEGISYRFDEDDHNTHIIYPDGGMERRWYDADGNLLKVCLPCQYDEQSDSGDGYTYEYDIMGRLTCITAPDKTILERYEYDLHGNMTKSLSTKGIKENMGTLYTYNYAGWLTQTRTPLILTGEKAGYRLIQYMYDKSGNCIKEKHFLEYQTEESAKGAVHTIYREYDADGRMIKVHDCTGAEAEYRYDGANRKIYEKQKINEIQSRILRYRYDGAGRLIELVKTADRQGSGRRTSSVRFEYDSNGNNIHTILPSGGEIFRKYDDADRLVSERHTEKKGETDNTTRFEYDRSGNIVSVTDNRGRKTLTEYDYMNREIKITERDQSVTRKFYDRNGRHVKTVLPNEYRRAGEKGKGTEYTYDANGNILTVVLADASLKEQNIYDENGELVKTVDAAGAEALFTYDFGGRRIRIQTGGKASQQYEYDAMGNITGATDGNGNRTVYVPDRWGRTVEIITADGSREYYAYDHAGNITGATDAKGNTVRYTYNDAGLPSTMTDAEGNVETYAYDSEERLCMKTDRNGTATRYTYNMYGNLTMREAYIPGEKRRETEKYTYTSEGLLKTALSGGMCYEYIYDEMDRLKEKKASARTLLSLEYDGNSNLISRTDVTGKKTLYSYDILDRVTHVCDNGKETASYEYNADQSIKTLKCGSLTTSYDYDADKNLTRLKIMLGDKVLSDTSYSHDGNGNCIQKRQKDSITAYAYDTRNRLTEVKYPDRNEKLYYDNTGNRTGRIVTGPDIPHTEESYTHDRNNRITTYTNNGRQSEYTYDANGNLLKDNKAEYTYDLFNRNIKTRTISGNTQINRYDAEGLRHEMEENGELVTFIYHDKEVITEESKTGTTRYIRTDTLLASDAENARTYYHYASDNLGSITHVVSEEEILNRYEYDAWGTPVTSEETVPNRFLFNGQQYDKISGQYYLRARFYNPKLGRFTQEDTYRGDGLNLYTYCANNPLYYIDPSGNICEPAANRIMEKLDHDNATRNEQKKLAAYLRNKERHGGLTKAEQNALRKVDGRTYASRYENQTIPRRDGDVGGSGINTLYHYTNENGMNGIVDSQKLNPSLKANNPNDCFYGEGQYLSDIVPGTKTPAQLSRNFIHNPFQGNKYSHYVEIDVTDLEVTFGRDNVFVILNQEPLDLTNRIISFGKVGD